MKSFFVIRIFVYIFFIIHIILSINKIEIFPIFGWNLYPYTHPYKNLYIVKVVSENYKTPVRIRQKITFMIYNKNILLNLWRWNYILL